MKIPNKNIINNLKVPYIGWEIKSTCNMGCQFCYASAWNQNLRQDQKIKDPSLDEIINGLSFLKKAKLGIQYINWTGGEVFLRHVELPIILKESTKLGFKNIISTNGMYSPIFDNEKNYIRFLRSIESHLSWLSVSLDADNEYVNNNIMRLSPQGESGSLTHYKDVISFLKIIKKEKFLFNLKINTIITSKNSESVIGIADILKNIPCIWKLIQFNPRECPDEYRRKYFIDQLSFLDIYNKIVEYNKTLKPPSKSVLSIRLYEGTNEPYCVFVINSNGDILLPKGEKHLVLINLQNYLNGQNNYDDFKQKIIENITKYFIGTNLYENIIKSENMSLLKTFSLANKKIYDSSYSKMNKK